MPIIAFDESGNTGQNLLDPNQPHFALASVNYSNEEVGKLLEVFDSAADELHFKALKKYAKSKQQILDFCNHDLISVHNIKYYVANKKLVLIGHIVDRFIEPVMYEMGKDIYKDRSNIIITNLLYIFCEQSWDKALVGDFYTSFQNLVRKPSQENMDVFYLATHQLNESLEDKDAVHFLTIIEDSKEIKAHILEAIKPYIIDLTFPTFNVLADDWYKELGSQFEIIHDNSKAIEFWHAMIMKLSNPTKMEEKEVGFGESRMTYPLKFTKVELVDSKDFKQVQVSDLIASSLCYGLNNEKEIDTNDFVRGLLTSKLFNMFHHSIRPLDLGTISKFISEGDQEGNNSLDYLAEMEMKNKG